MPFPNADSGALHTRWSVLGQLDSTRSDEAWSWFVERYRPTIRALLVRQLGAHVDAAVDDFWSYLFEHGILQRADRTRRFRTFLGGVVRRYARAWSRQEVPKHGHGDADAIESPDPALEDEDMRLWSQRIVALALSELRRHNASTAELLQQFYGVSPDGAPVEPISVAEIARRRESTAGAIHQALHRSRLTLRRLVEAEIRELVADRDAMEQEVRSMFAAIARSRPGLLG